MDSKKIIVSVEKKEMKKDFIWNSIPDWESLPYLNEFTNYYFGNIEADKFLKALSTHEKTLSKINSFDSRKIKKDKKIIDSSMLNSNISTTSNNSTRSNSCNLSQTLSQTSSQTSQVSNHSNQSIKHTNGIDKSKSSLKGSKLLLDNNNNNKKEIEYYGKNGVNVGANKDLIEDSLKGKSKRCNDKVCVVSVDDTGGKDIINNNKLIKDKNKINILDVNTDTVEKYYHCGLQIDPNKKNKKLSLFEQTLIQDAIWRTHIKNMFEK